MASEPVDASAAADLVLSAVSSVGEPHAVVELDTKTLERIASLSYRVLRRLGLAENVVADAVQDALIVIHRRLPEFRGESKFETWVYGILLRVASDHRRKQRRAARVFAFQSTAADIDVRCGAPNPFEHLEQQRAADFLKCLLENLPEPAREVFVLIELEELTLGATAQALRISESTVKSRLRTARKAFDAALQRELARRSSGATT